MSLSYAQQRSYVLAGSKNVNTLAITGAALTTAYTGISKIAAVDYSSQAVLYIQYTPGAGGTGNYLMFKLEFGPDATNFMMETADLSSPGTTISYPQERKFDNNGSTVALTTYAIRIPIQLADRGFKFSAKEVLVGGSAGVLFAELIVSGK